MKPPVASPGHEGFTTSTFSARATTSGYPLKALAGSTAGFLISDVPKATESPSARYGCPSLEADAGTAPSTSNPTADKRANRRTFNVLPPPRPDGRPEH